MCVVWAKTGGLCRAEDSGGSSDCIRVFVPMVQRGRCWLTVGSGEYTFKGRNSFFLLYCRAGQGPKVNSLLSCVKLSDTVFLCFYPGKIQTAITVINSLLSAQLHAL